MNSSLVGYNDSFSRSNPDLIDPPGTFVVNNGDIVKLVLTERDANTFGWMTGVNLTIAPVPVPSTLFLLFSGIGLIAGIRRKK